MPDQQPRTIVPFDDKTLRRLLRNVSGISKASRNQGYVAEVPRDIGIELTNRCNLRCKHCFLWNEQGFYKNSESYRRKKIELDWNVLDKVLRASEPAKSNLFFWGTEPLLYSSWNKIADRLETDRRWTVICTNGTLIERHMDSLIKISENLAVVISIDGFRQEHDAFRGQGAFDRIMKAIRLLQDQAKGGAFRGLLTLHCVLQEELVPRLFDFACFCESLAIDSLYVGYPWFINSETAAKMDEVVRSDLSFLNPRPAGETWSWHTYRHHLPAQCLPELESQLDKIAQRPWKMRFRFQPALQKNELVQFLAGDSSPAQARSQCLALANRIDIRCTGKVTSCQCFPELEVGDLNVQELSDVWHGAPFNRVRKVVRDKGLLPVCSKCILLYLNGR